MSLRCFVFSSDGGTAGLIRQMLADLSVEAESCADAVVAAEKITNQAFQIVIIDWDKQPEAGVLLTTARERKAAERPITLALVSDEKSVPGALQAGANSILRKPIVLTQAKDTLTTARDLIRAKQSASAGTHAAAQAATAGSKPAVVASVQRVPENTLRTGELLPTFTVTPGAQFETESEKIPSPEHSTADLIDPLKDLEPIASAVPKKKREPEPAPEPQPSPTMASEPEGRGLEWYLKNRVSRAPAAPEAPVEPESPAPAAKRRQNPELVGYDGIPSQAGTSASNVKTNASAESNLTSLNLSTPSVHTPESASKGEKEKKEEKETEQKTEAELFAYMDGERPAQPAKPAQPRFGFGKKAIILAAGLAACGIVAAPQAPWHPQLRALWTGGQKTVHAWLNPQPATPPPQPAAHEDFARAGDEYKLPVAEPIPDATTDPSQIQVVPEVDPTAKKPNDSASTQPQAIAVQPDPSAVTPAGQAATSTAEAPNTQVPQVQPQVLAPQVQPTQQPAQTTAAPVQVANAKPSPVIPQSLTGHSPDPFKPSPPTPQLQPVSSPANVPSSLKSQMASMTPDAGGNKAPETALPSIEPVNVSEAAERALISDQPAIAYPDNAKGQQGSVVLQVLIGRDGVVQDAKFLQGSFVFARAAIDGVKPWKFKPYVMNGRPVQVQTSLTLKFKPGQ